MMHSDNHEQIKLSAVCFSSLRKQQAIAFCSNNKLELKSNKDPGDDLQLIFHDDLIELYDNQLNTSISIDFLHGSLGHRHAFGGGRGQAIAKAAGLKSGKSPIILDLTAGLAGDAFILASLGCPVTMLERSAIVHLLIEDAIERAHLNDSFQSIITQGFKAIHSDAIAYIECQLQKDVERPEVIYIDPMYPERKKSALVKKDMQILQRLHGSDDNAEQLLQAGLVFATKRVVVKRPTHASPVKCKVAGFATPSTSIKSKKTRYDIYALSKL